MALNDSYPGLRGCAGENGLHWSQRWTCRRHASLKLHFPKKHLPTQTMSGRHTLSPCRVEYSVFVGDTKKYHAGLCRINFEFKFRSLAPCNVARYFLWGVLSHATPSLPLSEVRFRARLWTVKSVTRSSGEGLEFECQSVGCGISRHKNHGIFVGSILYRQMA